MKHSLKLVLAGAVLLAVSGVAHAETGKMYVMPKHAAGSPQDVVRDSNGNPVRTMDGGCVRTNWDAACDPCAEPKPQPAAKMEIPLEARTVYFDLNKSVLTPASKTKLDALVETLSRSGPVKSLRIAGYADRLGSAVHNEKLSKKRADAVRKYLEARGVAVAQIVETRWFGETVPATKCPSDMKRKELVACLQKDRRVEVEVEFGIPGMYIVPKAEKAPVVMKGKKKAGAAKAKAEKAVDMTKDKAKMKKD